MSASEKLKALDGKFELLRIDDMPPPVIQIKFWPQIVAVVEAAENLYDDSVMKKSPVLMADALAALEEALK